jgi:hypothetical protein
MATPSIRQRGRPEGMRDLSEYPIGGSNAMPSFLHGRTLLTIEEVLIRLLAPESLVARELLVMKNPHNLRDNLLPDLLVKLGAGELDPVYGVPRNQYRNWDEGGPPDLVLEAASKTTVGRDSAGKKEDYAAMGVREYVQFDPTGELLEPRLKVFYLAGTRFVPAPVAADGSVRSMVLEGYAWVRLGDVLRLRDAASGQLAPTPAEAAEAAEAARADAMRRVEDKDAEIAALRAELARFRGAGPGEATPSSESRSG